MHNGTTVPPVVHLWFLRTEASLGPTFCNIHRPYIHINTREGDPISSILALPSLPLPFHFSTTQHHGPCEEDGYQWRLGPSSPGDRLPLIAVKVAETSEAPLKDLCNLRLCNKATKRAPSSCAIANRFNLKHHYHTMDWGADYLQTVDQLQGANNKGALFIKGMDGICTG
jgi:hypothetical protein